MPSINTGLKVLSILQNHYVERMGKGLVVNMPWVTCTVWMRPSLTSRWWINTFFGAITHAMDPITRDKIRFNPDLTELAPAQQLDVEFGGDYHLKFDHATYWKTITEWVNPINAYIRSWWSGSATLYADLALWGQAYIQAPDGTRVDKEGLKWYPPAGNGILAASQGYFPKKGSIILGDLTTDEKEGIKVSGPDEGTPIAGVSPKMANSAAGMYPIPHKTERTILIPSKR
jgi:hypothetical protein